MQAPHGDTGDKKTTKATRTGCSVMGIVVFIVVAITVCTIVPIQYFSVDTRYSVGIDSVSRLDPATGLSFNLTLRVASRSHGAKACINPGMSVEVFYHGVQVAGSIPETRKICAGPRKTAEVHVVAMATGVPVGHVLDSLEADMRQGAPVFDAKLNVPADSFGGVSALASWLTDCKGARVGGDAVTCESPDQS